MFLEYVDKSTVEYKSKTTKKRRKEIAQFFSSREISQYMSSLCNINAEEIKILDCGAGTGMLSAALIEKLIENEVTKYIELDLYENDENVIKVLLNNMEYIKQELSNREIEFRYNIINKNFITSNQDKWNDIDFKGSYDVVISNPPYKKLSKSSNESQAMLEVVHGQPNIYFLFMAMSAKLLKEDREMIFIVPRSFTSGAYFKSFRKWFLDNTVITNIHLFNSRKKVFSDEDVLQESIIIRAQKGIPVQETITIASTEDGNFNHNHSIVVPYETVVKNNEDRYIFLPINEDEVNVLDVVNRWEYSLNELGFGLKTGPVVDFRSKEYLRENQEVGTVPLIWSYNFKDSFINIPVMVDEKPQFIINSSDSNNILLPNKDYLLVKRFATKEEARRIQCSIYKRESYSEFDKIGIENHINYFAKKNGEVSDEELNGFFVLLNSTIIDKYYRILNGSTQINAGEVNALPMPSIEKIVELGRRILESDSKSSLTCDNIINEVFNNIT